MRVVELGTVSDKASLLGAFAAGIDAPAWVGRNWDALSDALRDLSWWESGERGRALVVAGARHLGPAQDTDWATLCEILEEAANRWHSTPTPLGVLVRGRALA